MLIDYARVSTQVFVVKLSGHQKDMERKLRFEFKISRNTLKISCPFCADDVQTGIIRGSRKA